MVSNIYLLTAGLAATASAFNCNGNYFSFFNRDGPSMSYQRLDPALFPGTDSPHLHSFDGGNALTANTKFAQTQDSSCSTARIKQDKSIYWRPTLFWNGNGTGFYRVPEKATKIYYKYGDGDGWANVTEFPEDFNMIAGRPLKRSDGDNDAGVRWGCHQPDGSDDKIFANGFPKGFQSCNYGFATEVTFPSCWNGQKLDPKNPTAHMAYPTGYSGVGVERCPSTHRAARFPTIFIEFWYDISSFNGKYSKDSVPWVLSNGDSTGFSMHADFLNGWEKGVLGRATSKDNGCTCGCGCGQKEMEDYFGAENVNKNDDAAFKSCSAQGGKPSEASTHFDTLPGCNPIQSGPADATVVTGPNCAATAAPAPEGSKPSAAVSSPAATPPAKISSAQAYASSVKKDDVPLASVSFSLPNKGVDDVKPSTTPTPAAPSKQYGNAPSSAKDAVKPTPVDGAPKPSGTPAGGKDGDCKAPVYVTVTPTIFVTAGANSTSCGLGTVTKTMTQTATITIDAQGGFEYGSY